MSNILTINRRFHIEKRVRGKREILPGPEPVRDTPTERVPRLSRLMALAIHFDGLIRSGGITDYAELASLGHVSRARVTQIMNLLLLAPDIQEKILFLPSIADGNDPYPERKIRPITKEWDWKKQRQLWVKFLKKSL